jgi:molybdate transport system regulatory protein
MTDGVATAMAKNLTLRFRVDFGTECSVGLGKIELLERIALAGSLSKAARELHMSYRRAWLLLEDMNLSFDQPVARASVGGRGGGGAVLTPFGERLVGRYRKLESEVQPLAQEYLQEFGKRVKTARSKNVIPVVSIKGQLQRGRKGPPVAADSG